MRPAPHPGGVDTMRKMSPVQINGESIASRVVARHVADQHPLLAEQAGSPTTTCRRWPAAMATRGFLVGDRSLRAGA